MKKNNILSLINCHYDATNGAFQGVGSLSEIRKSMRFAKGIAIICPAELLSNHNYFSIIFLF